MKNKVIAIIILAVVASIAIYADNRHGDSTVPADSNSSGATIHQPLPPLTSAQQRVSSYTPQPGDLKYRQILKPEIGPDQTPSWNLYTSREYGFIFIYPASTTLVSTEDLGYQLPPNEAYKGSRDNFQIEITNRRNAVYLLFLNNPNFTLQEATSTSLTTALVNGITMTKEILTSTDPEFLASEMITYKFEKNKRQFIWYGAFDAKDFESINDFLSVVNSTTFNP